MAKWIELEKKIEKKKKTIDKNLQEQINKEKEHREKVLLRIIVIVKYLSKNNLVFCGTNEKIYEKIMITFWVWLKCPQNLIQL